MLHTLPAALPIEWLASKKLPSSNGCYETWIVIHPSNSNYHPYVVHKAWYVDEGEFAGTFAYGNGQYCKTLVEAHEYFKERSN
jgi:hypothetical protein